MIQEETMPPRKYCEILVITVHSARKLNCGWWWLSLKRRKNFDNFAALRYWSNVGDDIKQFFQRKQFQTHRKRAFTAPFLKLRNLLFEMVWKKVIKPNKKAENFNLHFTTFSLNLRLFWLFWPLCNDCTSLMIKSQKMHTANWHYIILRGKKYLQQ